MADLYNHMMDVAFEVEISVDGEAINDRVNLPVLLERARARLDEIEREGNLEAFGLCDSYLMESVEE